MTRSKKGGRGGGGRGGGTAQPLPEPAPVQKEESAEEQAEEPAAEASPEDAPKQQHPQIYSEDVVCSRTNPKKVGLVAYVPWETDSEDDDEADWFGDEEDDEEEEEEEADDGDDAEEGAEGAGDEEGGDDAGGDEEESDDEQQEGDEAEDLEDVDDDEDDEDSDTKVEVTWLAKNPWHDPTDTLEEPEDLQVIDRAFLPGDIVGRADDPFGQSGTVLDVDLRLDIKLSSGEVLQNVSSKNVRSVHPFGANANVVKGGWLGTVHKCTVNLHIRFPNGSVCLVERVPRINKETGEMVSADDDEYSEDELVLYYPTMEIFVDELGKEIVRNATWISGAYRRNLESGIVIKVEPVEVSVDWIAATFMTTGEGADPPDHLCQPSELTVLEYFGYCNWQIFDIVLIDPEPQSQHPEQPQQASAAGRGQDGQGGNKAPVAQGRGAKKAPQSKYLAKKNKQREKQQQMQQQKDRRKAETRCGMIMRTRTRVTVTWQDATCEEAIPSVSLIPLHDLLDADFWPQDFVQEVIETQPVDQDNDERDIVTGKTNSLRKVMERLHLGSEEQIGAAPASEASTGTADQSSTGGGAVANNRLGIVKKVDSAARTCVVRWLTGQAQQPTEGSDDAQTKDKEREELEAEAEAEAEKEDEEEVSFYQIMVHPDFKYRLGDLLLKLPAADSAEGQSPAEQEAQGQWVGELVALKDGKLLVHWSNATRSWARPDQVYALDPDEDWHGNGEVGEEDADAGGDDSESEEGLSSAAAAALTATGPNAGLMQSVVSAASNWWAGDLGEASVSASVGPLLATPTTRQARTEAAEESDDGSESEDEGEASESEDDSKGASEGEQVKAVDSESPFAFLPSDSEVERLVIQRHRFRGETQAPPNQREWTAAVVKEWGILKKSLPPGVYVRGFGSRMDLLKVLIIGSSGTPYVHSPFVFDVYLPPTYPHAPPLVHYCATLNERLHPNLYETGKVCLSLLGTWEGKGVETWNPATSNLLQLVVSIQGLILGTAEPYYLEAGYEKFRGSVEGERKSKLYNEGAFLLSFRAMSATLRNPPLPFQLVIRRYYADHAKAIAELCQAYLLEPVDISGLAEGKEEGREEAATSKPPLTHTPSKGFCRALTNVLPRLMLELRTNQQLLQEARSTPQ